MATSSELWSERGAANILSVTLSQRITQAVVALVLAPAVGLAVMLAISEQVESAWEGGFDWGVIGIGSLLAAAVAFVAGTAMHVPGRSRLRWTAAALILTSATAMALILATIWLLGDFPTD